MSRHLADCSEFCTSAPVLSSGLNLSVGRVAVWGFVDGVHNITERETQLVHVTGLVHTGYEVMLVNILVMILVLIYYYWL